MVITRTFNLLVPFVLTKYNTGSVIRHYTVFPPTYIKPIYRKEDQDQLYQEKAEKKLAHVPIKPAFSSETSSEFYDASVKKFTNYVMRKGNKLLARTLIEKTLETIKIMQLERYNNVSPEKREAIVLDPKIIFHRAIENSTPILELQKVRRGGITYQVPIPIDDNRARFLAMNWLIRTAKEKERTDRFYNILAKEILDAFDNRGRVIKKKQELHKQCEANRAYAHYRWS